MNRALQIGLPIVLLLAGIGATRVLASYAAVATPTDVAPAPLNVEVISVQRQAHDAVIYASGTMQPATQIDLVTQVPGRVVWTAPGLTPGARFAEGETIARIDARDFEAQVVQARANLANAELNLALEQARAQQAGREQELLGQAADNALARRDPQLAAATAAVEAAKASLSIAELNLQRTRLLAPFDAIVTTESLDVGQYIAPGAAVARLIGTSRFRVRVGLPVHELGLIDIPDLTADAGSAAIVRQRLADGSVLQVEGFVLRALGELDPQTRTGAVLIAIDDPLGQTDGALPILPGAFVDVEIRATSELQTLRVPRIALDGGDHVWLADPESRLQRRAVTVAWGDPTHVYLQDGLEDGERVVITPMALPVVGLSLITSDATPSTAE